MYTSESYTAGRCSPVDVRVVGYKPLLGYCLDRVLIHCHPLTLQLHDMSTSDAGSRATSPRSNSTTYLQCARCIIIAERSMLFQAGEHSR